MMAGRGGGGGGGSRGGGGGSDPYFAPGGGSSCMIPRIGPSGGIVSQAPPPPSTGGWGQITGPNGTFTTGNVPNQSSGLSLPDWLTTDSTPNHFIGPHDNGLPQDWFMDQLYGGQQGVNVPYPDTLPTDSFLDEYYPTPGG